MFSEATREFIQKHQLDDIRQLALSSRSIAGSGVDVQAAITQIAGRQSIENKIPSWYHHENLIYPQQLSLEQCSSESTAKYKASLLSGESFVDLTGGFGVDCTFIAQNFQKATYVERQSELCEIVAHNFSQLGLDFVEIMNADAIHYLEQMHPVDSLFVDPARRGVSGKKTVAIADCDPDVEQIRSLLLAKAGRVLIKLSPMLDITLALQSLPETLEVHVVSVENECKEVLFLMQQGWEEEPSITCVNFRKKADHVPFVFKKTEERNAVIESVSEIREYLYEPNASLLKAGAFKVIALRYGLKKLHPDSHLYTSSELITDFPGRSFRVETTSSLNKKELKPHLQGMNQANIAVRNFPLSVNDLRKKLELKEGGEVYLFATTLADARKVLIFTRKCGYFL